jgi:hypothetical protein
VATDAGGVAERVRKRDASLWSADAAVRRSIENRLGWLDAPAWASSRLDELRSFASEVSRFSTFVLLGMGGSSLAPEVLARTFGIDRLVVLDSTDPSELRAAERRIDPSSTLFFVASKSGGTIETLSQAAYFLGRTGDASRFVAITDPGSPLESNARSLGYARVFLNPPDVGGRYSALTYFGLVPAAALGIDVAALLDGASRVSDQAAAALGIALGDHALEGRDKITFAPAPGFASFGAWAEQLLAESTGKDGKGLIPVDGEALGAPETYGGDRVLVPVGARIAALDTLAPAGRPELPVPASEPADLGGLFFTFEFATAVTGWRLGVNPFDEPNVSESKENTARLIEVFEREGGLPSARPSVESDGVQLFGGSDLGAFLRGASPGDYVALLAFVPRNEANERILTAMRALIRDRLRVATTLGFGPRYLHSTGQLHKGGPNSGLFLQITTEHPEDVPIPGKRYSFGVLQAAQAAGDYDSLKRHDRRVMRVHLADGVERGLPALAGLIDRSLA